MILMLLPALTLEPRAVSLWLLELDWLLLVPMLAFKLPALLISPLASAVAASPISLALL